MHLKMSSGKCRPFCPGLNMLMFVFLPLWCHTQVAHSPFDVIGHWCVTLTFFSQAKSLKSNEEKKVHFMCTVYPKKYAHGFCFAVLCCGYTLTDFPISIRLTSLALWQSNDCPSASEATLMNMDKYFMWIHYERLHNHNKAKHNKTVCIFLGMYCTWQITFCLEFSVHHMVILFRH